MKLEDQIREKRGDMDIEKPDEDFIWAGISQNLKNRKGILQMHIWKVAVAVIMIFIVSYTIVSRQFLKQESQLILVKFDPVLAKEEAQILRTIDFYYDELSNAHYDDKNLATQYSELDQIDTLISKYAQDLKVKGTDPRILSNLMNLYQKKVRILNRMLNEIEKNERYDKNTTKI